MAGTCLLVLVAIPLMTDTGDDPTRWIVGGFAAPILPLQLFAIVCHSWRAALAITCIQGGAMLLIPAAAGYGLYLMDGMRLPALASVPIIGGFLYVAVSAWLNAWLARVWWSLDEAERVQESYMPLRDM